MLEMKTNATISDKIKVTDQAPTKVPVQPLLSLLECLSILLLY